jgi:hypothetical protein
MLALDRYVEVLREDAELLALTLDSGDLSAPVRACPGWTLADLGYHIGDVARFWNWVATTHAVSVDDEPTFPRPPDPELADWVRDGMPSLIRTLQTADASAPAWSWTRQKDIAFIQRRMPHETSVHRWDAQDTAHAADGAAPMPVVSDLAADGVSEFFLLASAAPVDGSTFRKHRVSLRATDTGHAWSSWVDDGNLMQCSMELADADVTMAGTASDLLLTLWRRIPLDGDRVRVEGDRDIAQTFVTLASLD